MTNQTPDKPRDRIQSIDGGDATYQCPDCQRARLFTRIHIPFGTDADAEWACAVCGAALLVDPPLDTRSPIRAVA